MTTGRYNFGQFSLDPVERRLINDDEPVELNSRYFDALLLFLDNPGVLITKDHLLKEVWRGIPVTDEVLTQCIKILRRQLGDNASNPSFIETVPKHGYRFIADVECVESRDYSQSTTTRVAEQPPAMQPSSPYGWPKYWRLVGAGTTGGGLAGLCGGTLFGLAAVTQSAQGSMGAISTLLVVVSLATLLSLLGAAGVALGIATAGHISSESRTLTIIGGASGGFLIGAVGKGIGLDAFQLLLGQPPGDITGPVEGMLLGAAIGCSLVFSNNYLQTTWWKPGIGISAVFGGLAGILITLLDGHLFIGSLAQLGDSFPDSRLQLDPLGAFLGPFAEVVTNSLEGALFCIFVAGVMMSASR